MKFIEPFRIVLVSLTEKLNRTKAGYKITQNVSCAMVSIVGSKKSTNIHKVATERKVEINKLKDKKNYKYLGREETSVHSNKLKRTLKYNLFFRF